MELYESQLAIQADTVRENLIEIRLVYASSARHLFLASDLTLSDHYRRPQMFAVQGSEVPSEVAKRVSVFVSNYKDRRSSLVTCCTVTVRSSSLSRGCY